MVASIVVYLAVAVAFLLRVHAVKSAAKRGQLRAERALFWMRGGAR